MKRILINIQREKDNCKRVKNLFTFLHHLYVHKNAVCTV